jgi:hypothetical protein
MILLVRIHRLVGVTEARSHTVVIHTRLSYDDADICRYALQDAPYILAQ